MTKYQKNPTWQTDFSPRFISHRFPQKRMISFPFPNKTVCLPGRLPKSLWTPQPKFYFRGYTFTGCLLLHHLLITLRGDEVLRRRQELSQEILQHTCEGNGISKVRQRVRLRLMRLETKLSKYCWSKGWFTIREAIPEKVTKLRTSSVPPWAPSPPFPPHLGTLMGVFFLIERTRDSRHLAKKIVCYHFWGNLSFSLEIHKFWC